ncbi:DMT family transporter [Leifsonia sp. fls2-241-R2A-40a]|uniref:DMT family transporter n=1 Tax=Leifsonia sp. fls2-241-R2A-40a TaxID=3040290 RepID=UPI0025516211|nr:DMT family transporter [Leifsonia sp. fls2-241-R2A-40a]
MPAAVLGLLSAIVYGSADFFGGVAARRIGPVRATAVGAVSGLALLLLAFPIVGGEWSAAAVGWGALSGLVGTVAIGLLYACLAIGPMSILSPLTALVSALIPMTWGLIGGDRFGLVGSVALGLALVAVVLVGFVPEKGAVRPSGRALLMAVAAGALIGVFLILLDQTPPDSGVVPLLANRAVNGAVMWTLVGILVLRSRRRHRVDAVPRFDRRGTGIASAGGALDATANLLILIGLRVGDLTTMSVLVALYPAGTILLAAVVLRERVAPVQWVGLALAVTAAALLALD